MQFNSSKLKKWLYPVTGPILAGIIVSCAPQPSAPQATAPPVVISTNTATAVPTNTPIIVIPTSTSIPTATPMPIPTATSTATPTPTPQISDRRLEDFMNQYGTYFLNSQIILPQKAREIARWSEDVMHLNQVETYYRCMLSPDRVANWNWDETSNCLNTIDNLLNELHTKVVETTGPLYPDDEDFFRRANDKIDLLAQLAEYEDTAQYKWEVSETNIALTGFNIFINSLPERVGRYVTSPSFLGLPDYFSIYYMFTDNQRIGSYRMDYTGALNLFGNFFENEHDYSKRIFIFGGSIRGMVGIFEYGNTSEADNALNRLYNSVGVDDRTYTIDDNEYRMIYFKVPGYEGNLYAHFIRRGRFLLIAEPTSDIKGPENWGVVRNFLTPLLS